MAEIPTLRIDRSLRRSLRAFSRDRLRYLDDAAALGPVAGLRFGPATVFVLTDADAARRILVTDSESWTRPPAMRLPVQLGVGENIFTQPDEVWARTQPLVAPALRGPALAARLERLDEIVESEVAEIPRDHELDLELVMGRLALVIAAWVFLGDRLAGGVAEELADHQRRVVDWVGRRLGALTAGLPVAVGSSAHEMRGHRIALERYVDGAIARTADRAPSDGSLLAALLGGRVSGRALTPTQVRSHVLGLLLAGNETMASALSWILVHGAEHPVAWSELRREPSRADAFVAETLRLRPPAWGLTRTPTRGGVALDVDGRAVRVRRPAVVTVYLRGIHRDAAVWADPERFDPGRHGDPSREQIRGLLPFALGPRGCIGQLLALAELRAVTPALARIGTVVVSQPVEEDASFALRPRGGLRGRLVT
ncbi:MAG: cytochrome P450 [Acidimicrobiia bacterium]